MGDKNIADAYFELGFLPKAEEIYQSIQTEDTTLTMEVSLQLLSLYIEQDRLGLAFKTISEAVAFQPIIQILLQLHVLSMKNKKIGTTLSN